MSPEELAAECYKVPIGELLLIWVPRNLRDRIEAAITRYGEQRAAEERERMTFVISAAEPWIGKEWADRLIKECQPKDNQTRGEAGPC